MKKNLLICSLFLLFLQASCTSFLDEKPDIKLVVPKSLNDLELLMNDYSTMNANYPNFGELSSDDYYLTKDLWESASVLDQRNAYIWADLPYEDASQWRAAYKVVNNANQVLDVLKTLDPMNDKAQYSRLKGEAHFFRAFAFQQLVGTFCNGYKESGAAAEQGIPLRLHPDVDENVSRSSLKDSYNQILSDYQVAIRCLPSENPYIGKPSLKSAYAAMGRAYLDMGDFEKAFLYADSAIAIYPDLIDFNTVNSTDELPFTRFNKEVLFPAVCKSVGIMSANVSFVDSVLCTSYASNDLRNVLFLESSTIKIGAKHFKGSYDRSTGNLFVGLSSSEQYLIKAEAAARLGKINSALSTINTLLKNRWKTGTFVDWTETDADQLLPMILEERRKEMLYRGRRWSDLKRLNLDNRFKITLKRVLGNNIYTLEPNSPKYAYRLPEIAVNLGGIPQNQR